MLAWIRKSSEFSPRQQLMLNIKTSLYEMSLHGQRIYEEFCERLSDWMTRSEVSGVHLYPYEHWLDRRAFTVLSVDVPTVTSKNCLTLDVMPSPLEKEASLPL
jgi:hypothetical protein